MGKLIYLGQVSTTGFTPALDENYASIINLIYEREIVFEYKRVRQKLFYTDLILVFIIDALFLQ